MIPYRRTTSRKTGTIVHSFFLLKEATPKGMLSNEKSQSLRISIQDEDAIFEISFKIKEEVKKKCQ